MACTCPPREPRSGCQPPQASVSSQSAFAWVCDSLQARPPSSSASSCDPSDTRSFSPRPSCYSCATTDACRQDPGLLCSPPARCQSGAWPGNKWVPWHRPRRYHRWCTACLHARPPLRHIRRPRTPSQRQRQRSSQARACSQQHQGSPTARRPRAHFLLRSPVVRSLAHTTLASNETPPTTPVSAISLCQTNNQTPMPLNVRISVSAGHTL